MTLKIQKAADGDVIVFALCGRIEGEQVEQLQNLLAFETEDHPIVLDLKEVDLVNRDAVRFLARCAAEGIKLDRCPAYIREWISREQQQ
jgi:anti-anti-sigma regulatory factor